MDLLFSGLEPDCGSGDIPIWSLDCWQQTNSMGGREPLKPSGSFCN